MYGEITESWYENFLLTQNFLHSKQGNKNILWTYVTAGSVADHFHSLLIVTILVIVVAILVLAFTE